MCNVINGQKICECDWVLIASWKIIIQGDLVIKYRYQCKCCGNTKIEE